MSHTPGPWRVGACQIVVSDSGPVADCLTGNQDDQTLIALAPALLQLARQYASECFECSGVGITIENLPCDQCADIRAVIATAEVQS